MHIKICLEKAENIEELDVINEEEPSIELDDVEEINVIPW